MEGDFRLGSWDVAPKLNSLSCNGKTIRLEPKVMQVLVCLAEAEDVVSKERLMRTVWADTFVTDDVLIRSISELRKAFTDDPKNPRFIQTIPKGGYRLIVPVTGPMRSNGNGAGNGISSHSEPPISISAPPISISAPVGVSPRNWPIKLAALTVAAVIALVGIYLAIKHASASSQFPEEKATLAVLPFQNLSNDPQQDYFVDGLTAEMISQLGQLPSDRLGVIAWNSVSRYKGVKKSEEEIGKDLGANYILEGTVRRAGNRVRITAELVHIGERSHIWANSYEGDLGDVLSLQNRVAREIASEIQPQLTPEQEARLKVPTTIVNAEGYDAYLKGTFYRNAAEPAGIRNGIESLQRAIILNPNHAPSYISLAQIYITVASWGYAPSKPTYATARTAVENALRLDPKSSDAYAALGWILWRGEWNFAEADKQFRRAVELQPGNVLACNRYSLYLKSMGRYNEALTQINRNLELNPMDDFAQANAGHLQALMYRWEPAMECFRKGLEISPNGSYVHERLGQVLLWQGKYKEAIAEFEKARENSGSQPEKLAWLAYANALSGKKTEALQLAEDLNRIWRDQRQYLSPFHMSLVYIGLGDKESALKWLQTAYDQHDEWMVYLHVYPEFNPLRSDSRFQDLERRVGLTR